uniref:Cdkn1a interacting zinc finger protein 1a n=1 Tax=Cyprinus carpio TaxID=7962 RepID=A0A8C1SHZ8_CYPCA
GCRMFNPHQQQQQQQQHQFHQHLRQLQHLFQQQQTPPPPPPPPQPPPAHHITHTRPMAVPAPASASARMVNLCSAPQTILAPNPMLQGALLMQQMQGGMRGFAMGGQQFPQFFTAGSRASLLGPVPMGVAIKTPHMGFQRHFTPHTRYFTNEFQGRQPDRKRDNEQKSAGSQSEASSSRADPGCQESSEQPDEPAAKKHRTQESEEPVETESAQSAEYKSPDPRVESTEAPDKDVEQQISDGPDDATRSDPVPEIKETTDAPEEVNDGATETSNKFFCYICNITCHNQQNFQSHMNGLTHQQKMMEIQHMSNACLVTLLPRVQESLQGARRDGEKRAGLQRWCSTCQTHFTTNVTEHRRTKEHKRCIRSSSSRCTVCKLRFRTHREFVEHMQSPEHQQRVQQLFLCNQIIRHAKTEFGNNKTYGSSFVVPVAGFLCRLCGQFYHFESSARHTHCKTLTHFQNLKRYKALTKHEDSGSSSADHISPDQTSLLTEPAPQTLQSCSSASHPAQEVQAVAQEEAVAVEPEPEGKSVRGRGRTPAKRRGRGARRR